MAEVVTCGPEASGTHLLHRVVTEYIGIDAVHRSLPHGDEGPAGDGWWEWGEFPDARFVIITRRPDVTGLAALSAGHVGDIQQHRDEHQRALGVLATIPDAYWVIYEALLLSQVQADNIARWLGVEPVGTLPKLYNHNAKWLSVLE